MKSKVLLVSLAAFGLAACGAADGASPDQTALGLTSTNYVTVTQTPTTLVPTTLLGASPNPGQVHPEEGTYVIVAGDFPSTIANKFKVTLNDLIAINGWTLANGQVPEFNSLAAGATIKIPPNWTEPGAVAATTDTSTDTPTGTTPSEPTTTVAGGQSACAPGEYTILAEDTSRVKVAKKLDTTVEALDAANTATKGYSGFFPGLKIKTPPKADC
jgi:LysM repeat protein